jgi:cobalamin transport system substrate-binding protein
MLFRVEEFMRHAARAYLTMLLVTVTAIAVTADPIAVTDDRGVDVMITEMPQRIVAVGAMYAQVLVDLGALDRLVAVADSPDNPIEVSGLPSVGPTYAPSVETILSLAPDLVLGATDWGGERPSLEAAGVTVLTTPLLTSVSDVLASVRSIGLAIGLSEEADDLVGRIAEAIVQAETQVLGQPSLRSAFLYPPSLGVPPYVAGRGTIENELILRAGGDNVFADIQDFPQINLEDLLTRDPEVIFTAPSQVAYITEDPLLQGINAVLNGRVYGINASRAASTSVAEVLAEMIQLIHPEAP